MVNAPNITRAASFKSLFGHRLFKICLLVCALLPRQDEALAQTVTPPTEDTVFNATTGFEDDPEGDGEYILSPNTISYPPGDFVATPPWDSTTSMIAETKASRLMLQDVARLLCVLIGAILAHATFSKVHL